MGRISLLTILLFMILFFNCKKNNETPAQPVYREPDLIGTSLIITSWTDSLLKYSFTIKNIGHGGANMDGPTDVDYDNLGVQAFQSEDTSYDPADLPAGGTILGGSPLGILEPGKSISSSFNFTSPNIDTVRYRYLILLVDWQDNIKETNENNNTVYSKIN